MTSTGIVLFFALFIIILLLAVVSEVSVANRGGDTYKWAEKLAAKMRWLK